MKNFGFEARVFAIFGFLMVVAVSGWGAQAPVMSPDTMSASITTSASNGTVIADVNATDVDGNTLTYTITGGNSSGAFAINSSTGVITVSDKTKLSVTTYTLAVKVTDGTGWPNPRNDTGTVTVTVTSGTTSTTPIQATSQDICYNTPTYSGFCTPFFSFNCKETIPLQNISGEDLTNVDVALNTTGFSGSFFGGCGVNDVAGNCSQESAIDFGPVGMFNSGIAYQLPDFSDDEINSIYEVALIQMSMFSGSNLYATYTKDGTLYASEIVACASTVPITSDNERDFTLQYSVNEVGDMVLFGNTILCKSSKQNDSSYKTGNCVAPAASDSNDDIHTLYSKLSSDSSDSTIFNSSSSDLTIPAGSEVLWATLYWQGGINGSTIDTATGDSSLTDLNAAMQRAKTVKLKTPTGAYTTVTTNPTKFNWKHSGATYVYYQGAANVTSLVQQSGTYQVANIVTNDGDLNGGTGPYGGWALMVVYKDVTSGTSKLKNMVVYDGYKLVNSDITQTLSGFYTPPSGDVNAKFTTFAAEADATRTDRITMTNKTGTEVQVASNELDSSIEDSSGATVLTRTPNFGNTIGTDIHTWNVGNTGTNAKNIIGNAQSSTNVRFDYGTDIFNLGAFSFATDLYQPEVCYIENIFKDGIKISGQGVQVNRGDQIDVRVYVKNKGDEVAQKVQVFHQFDSEFEYVEDSANYNNANPPYEDTLSTTYTKTAATDELDADLYAYDLGATTSRVNLGTGADASNGGEFAASEAFAAVFEYSGTVEAIDSNYSNTYKVAFKNEDLGLDYTNNPLTMEPCEGERNSFWGYYLPPSTSGDFDVVHTTYYNSGLGTNIPTQIASRVDDFKILSYASGTTALQDINTTVAVELVDASSGSCETYPSLSGFKTWIPMFNVNQADLTASSIIAGVVLADPDAAEKFYAKAGKNVKFRISYPTDGSGGVIIMEQNSPTKFHLKNFPSYAGTTCVVPFTGNKYNPDGSLQGDAYYQNVPVACANNGTSASSGMYQSEVNICLECIYGANVEYVCSTDNFAIRPDTYATTVSPNGNLVAGEDFNLTAVAKGYNDSAIAGAYNGSAALSPLTQLVACEVDDGNITNNVNASASPLVFNGVDTNISNNIKFGDVGVFDINITDSTWSAVDSVKSPAECIVGSNTNVADANGTIGCDVRVTFIKTVIPDHFDVNGTLSNGSNGFTYLHNNDNNATLDQNISAILNVLVVAKSALDTNTSNYAGDCYAQDGNSTIGFVFTPEITPNGALTQLLWYDDNNHSALGASQNIVDNNRSTGIFSHPPVRFTSGVGSLRYRINFDRNVTQTLNPFMMSIPQVDVEDNDNVTGSTTQPIDNNATYVYGRVIARDVRIFGQKPFIANAWYEAFSQTPLTIGTTALAPSRTDTNWYIMAPHSDAVDGDANVTHMQTNGAVATGAPLFDTVTYVSGIETYEENTGWPLNRYKAHILTAPWLWYGVNALDYANPATGDDENACLTHPCFNINVVPAVGATGSAKEDAADSKANKRTTKDTTGWKSTSDYAPAVR